MPKFSVIIPIYNVEKYLRQCVDSVLNQEYTDFEVILVDDGSPDRCPEICDEYAIKDSRVRVIHKENAGVSLARQDGVAAARGEYVAFVDSDDRVTADYFDVISKHTDVDIIHFGYTVERADGTITNRLPKTREGLLQKADIEKEIFPYLIQSEAATYYCPSLWRHVFKRELFAANMVRDKVIKIGEDSACVIPCVYHAKSLYCIHRCLYVYHYNDISATKGNRVFPWDGPALIAEHLEEQINISAYDFRKQLDRKIVHELFLVAASQFYRKESYRAICRDVDAYIKQPYYQNAIKCCKYRCLEGIGAKVVLQWRLHWLLKLKAYFG